MNKYINIFILLISISLLTGCKKTTENNNKSEINLDINKIASLIDNKSDARAASFLLLSIVDGLVVQGILKAEKIPYSEIARFLIDYSNKIKTTSK